MTKKRTPTLMFELNSSYSNVQKTKKKTAAQNSYFGWDNWRKVRAGCISQDTYLLYTRNQMKINYLDARTTTLVLNVGMFKWPCWALQCDFQLHSFYLQLWSLSRGGHSSFPPFIVREIVQSQSFTVWITPFLPWKKPQLIKVFNNLMNVSKNIHEKKTNKKRYLGAVHKWRHHFWRVYTPPST